jgi:hypothetical protein
MSIRFDSFYVVFSAFVAVVISIPRMMLEIRFDGYFSCINRPEWAELTLPYLDLTWAAACVSVPFLYSRLGDGYYRLRASLLRLHAVLTALWLLLVIAVWSSDGTSVSAWWWIWQKVRHDPYAAFDYTYLPALTGILVAQLFFIRRRMVQLRQPVGQVPTLLPLDVDQ